MAAAADKRFLVSPVNRKPLSDEALNLSPTSFLDLDFGIILPTSSDSSGHRHAVHDTLRACGENQEKMKGGGGVKWAFDVADTRESCKVAPTTAADYAKKTPAFDETPNTIL